MFELMDNQSDEAVIKVVGVGGGGGNVVCFQAEAGVVCLVGSRGSGMC